LIQWLVENSNGLDETAQNLSAPCCSPKRMTSRALGDGMIPAKRPDHDGGSHLQSQMSVSLKPARLLLSIHSAISGNLRRRSLYRSSYNAGI
jgi:hypothetical protein